MPLENITARLVEEGQETSLAVLAQVLGRGTSAAGQKSDAVSSQKVGHILFNLPLPLTNSHALLTYS